MKFVLPGFAVLLVLAALLAWVGGPSMAQWIADNAHGGYAYGYDYAREEGPVWPVGSVWLMLAFVGFALVGGLVIAAAWAMEAAFKPPPPPDAKEKRVAKVRKIIESVNRRGDLTAGEKDGFKSSALTLAQADEPIAIRAADAIGEGDAVTAAKDLASEAEAEFLLALGHAANVALPFSDQTGKVLATRRADFARLDALVAAWDACEAHRAKSAKHCACGARIEGECACGDEDCELCCRCENCRKEGAEKGRHARLDVVWD